MHGGRRKPVGRSEVRGQKEHQDKGQDEGSNGSLPVIQLQAQIGQRKEPAKERHRTIQVMVRNRVQATGPLQKRKIMRHQAQPQERRTQSAREFLSRTEEANIQAETQEVGKRRQNWEYVIHSLYLSP